MRLSNLFHGVLITITRFIHILSAIVWIGGMIFISLFLNPALKKCVGPSERLLVLKTTASRFKWGSWIAILLLVLSGLLNVRQTFLEGKWSNPLYRGIMYAKFSLVGIVLALSALHDFWIGPTLARRMEEKENTAFLQKGIVLAARLNLVLALAIIFLAEWAAHRR